LDDQRDGVALLARLGARQLAVDRRPDRAQRAPEAREPDELLAVPVRAEVRVVAVLLAAARVAPGRLQVAARVRAEPHPAVGRRHGERVEARDLLAVADALAR